MIWTVLAVCFLLLGVVLGASVRRFSIQSKFDKIAAVRRAEKEWDAEIQRLSQERDILSHIMENMNTGVIYVASNGRVKIVNRAAELMFRRPAQQWTEREHWAILRDYHLGAAIDQALLFGKVWNGELTLRNKQILSIRLVPIPALHHHGDNSESAHNLLVICNDVSDWKRIERMRSEFVANVSHELKTPIAAIRGFAETLLDGDVDETTQQQFLRTIYEESYRMGNLVSDLLELSKLEGTEHRLNLTSVDLTRAIRRAFDRLQATVNDRDVTLRSEIPEELTVWSDEDMLLQVLLNLLSNAIHYTLDGGSISVTCDVLVDRVKIHVRDSGIGIAEEHLDRVFERFYRANRDRSRASGGTGLGLSIVKHIVNAHGGEVGVESEVGVGSDFWFTLSRLERNNDLH